MLLQTYPQSDSLPITKSFFSSNLRCLGKDRPEYN